MKSKSFIFLIAILIGCSNIADGQNNNKIVDFYEYANKAWLENTVLPENASVVNNWGILWDDIINKSIEILSGNVNYHIEENHQYILLQLQNFYKSAFEQNSNKRKSVQLIQKHYPMIFGTIFSEITIPDSKKEKIKELIIYLRNAYCLKIENSDKIGENSVDFFLAKLNDIKFIIGAPDISSLPLIPILSKNNLENNIKLSEEYQLKIKSAKPNWVSPPFETDCRYNFNENTVKIYAGTLFATSFNKEVNYPEIFATLGRTLAHEMTHAFDRYGKKFNKKDWKEIARSLVNQFNQYEIQDGHFTDGKKTLQENFADLGGIEVSLLALKLFIKDNYPNNSEEQNQMAIRNYFIHFARFWKEKATPEFELTSLNRIHTPQKYRAIGPIYNQNQFYEIFEIDTNSKYYIPKELRISIW